MSVKRVGLRYRQKVIVVEYRMRSNPDRRFHHNIKIARYCDSKVSGMSISRSNSFREAIG